MIRNISKGLLLAFCVAVPSSPAFAQYPALVDGGEGCGYVTTEAGNVPTQLSIFGATVTQIDGKTPMWQRYQHKLAAGKHVLVVGEEIDSTRLNTAQLRQIGKMKARSPNTLKAFILDVQPGTSYRIGTRLIRDRLDTQSIRDNAYWEPVVWDEKPEPCT
ncbi:MAG: hypothetical protein EON92_05845 [Burkholderiales bacterium]|nr:MAG: hypothetical protein EON92_05845 [Burkholderiales bacterium]